MELTCTGRLSGEHDWRMFTRDKQVTYDKNNFTYLPNPGNPLVQVIVPTSHTKYKELWYCIKCRYEETRIVDDVR